MTIFNGRFLEQTRRNTTRVSAVTISAVLDLLLVSQGRFLVMTNGVRGKSLFRG